MNELQEMLVNQLKDAFSAEKQAIQAMRRTLRKVSDPQLREGIQAHIEQSEQQRERVEQALEQTGAKPGRKVCEAMRGLVEEATHEMDEHEKGPVLDLVIVASQQRIEHYEIAAYGTMAELSKAMGQTEVANVLAEILAEEKAQDELLTELTRSSLLPTVLQGLQGLQGEEEDEGSQAQGSQNGRQSRAKRSQASAH